MGAMLHEMTRTSDPEIAFILTCGTKEHPIHASVSTMINRKAKDNHPDSEFICERRDYMNNTKMMNSVACNEDISGGLDVHPLTDKRIVVPVEFETDPGIDMSGISISSFDRMVMDSVYTYIVTTGSMDFTPQDIARIMSGSTGNVTRKKIDKIITSIEKLSVIRIKIDCTDELIKRGKIVKGQRVMKSSYLLPVECTEIIPKNHKGYISGYHLLQIPAMYEYAEYLNQIITVDSSLLSIGDLSNTDESITIKRYIIRRIEGMKNDKNNLMSRKITYRYFDHGKEKGLFKAIGYDESRYANKRKKRNDIHKTVIKILDAYTDKQYIKGYKVIKTNKQKITGVEIVI